MGGRPWVLAETALKEVRETAYDVAILPWGATEAHNYHLPYATDVFETLEVAVEAARIAWREGLRPLVLPALPFGANEQQLDIPGTINMHPSTQGAVLSDVIESVEHHGLQKLLILNGHGGNDFRQMIREAQASTPIFLSTVAWFRIPGTMQMFEAPGDHAGEMETSLMMHLRPDLVRGLDEAGSGTAREWKLDAIREGWAWAPRQWSRVTDDTGVGDPRKATAEKGAAFFEAVTQRLAAYLVELAECDPTDLYEASTPPG
ncbi:MAG TPA: creatininase family protein [Gemmatimonadetes bacterium]|nr:creatininase family protein [Gemmatimonadota bacterium]